MADQAPKSKIKIVAMILIIVTFAMSAIGKIWDGDNSLSSQLKKSAMVANLKLPTMIDDEIRWDSVVPGPGAQLYFAYTLINRTKYEVDVDQLKQLLKPQFVEMYKTSPELEDMRTYSVLLVLKIVDKNGEPTLELSVSPKDF